MARTASTHARVRVTTDTRQAQRGMNRFRRENQRAARGMVSDWRQATSQFRGLLGLAGVGATIGIATNALREFEATNRTLVAGTGATGEGLAELRSQMAGVARIVPIGLERTATVLADLDTIFNDLRSSSPELFAEIATGFARLENVFGQGVSSGALRAFRGFTEDLEDLLPSLDLLAQLGTQTPGGVGSITGFLNSYASALEVVNLDLNESLILTSNLLRENIRLERLTPGLARVRSVAAAEGRTANEVLFRQIEAVKSATTESQKLAIAQDSFGAEAGAVFLDAIKQQVFELGNLEDRLAGAEGSLEQYNQDVASATDIIGQFFSGLNVAVGEAIGGGTGAGIQSASERAFDIGRDFLPRGFIWNRGNDSTPTIVVNADTVIGEDGAQAVASAVAEAVERTGEVRPGPGIR